MNKSLAETVNFAQAVQTKAYEKKAQQVDTFVQSESAEQKLARSGKYQTAKAIEALAQLGGTVVDGMAKKREQEVQLLQQDLQNITAKAVQEAREGKAPYTSETFANLPIRMQTQVRNAIGYDKAKRTIAEASAGVNSFMLLDSDALAAHLDQYREGKEVLSAMDAHELLGYENAWQAGVDILNNKAIEAKTAQGEKEVQYTYKTELAQIISVEDTKHLNAMNSGVYDEKMEGMTPEQQDDFMELMNKQTVANTVAKVEAHFKEYPNEVGIDIPPKILKTWTREALIDAATATGNPFFLHPENFGNTNFQDDVSKWAFAKALRAFDDQQKSERRGDIAAANAQELADRRNARKEVQDGTLNEGNATSWIEREVVSNYNKSLRVPSPQSNTAMLTLQDSIREGVTKEGATHLLLKNEQGEFVPAIHPIDGKPVELNKEAILDYIEHLPTMLSGHKLTLQSNVDGLMVGMTSSSTYPAVETTKFFSETLDLTADDYRATTLLPQLELEAKRKWHGLYLQKMEDNQYKPLKETQLWDIQEQFNTWKEDRVGSIKINPKSEVSLDGTRVDVNADGELIGGNAGGDSKPSKFKDTREESLSRYYFENIDNPDAMAAYERSGAEIPTQIPDDIIADALEYMFEAEGDPSLTTNKGTIKFKKFEKIINSMSGEDQIKWLDTFAQEAVTVLEEQLESYKFNSHFYPENKKSQVRALIKKIKNDPKVALTDDSWASNFIKK